jgi:hypothetical protein
MTHNNEGFVDLFNGLDHEAIKDVTPLSRLPQGYDSYKQWNFFLKFRYKHTITANMYSNNLVAVCSALAVVVLAGSLIPSVLGQSVTDLFCAGVFVGVATGPQASACGVSLAQQLLQATPTCPTGYTLQGNFCVPTATTTTTRLLSPPIAIATATSTTVNRGSIVTLDGSGSTGSQILILPSNTVSRGVITSYLWTQTSGPSVGTLPNTVRPTFIAPQTSTTLAFTLTVTDSNLLVSMPSQPVVISVR